VDWIISIALGTGGFILLLVIYAGFEYQWPTSYRSLSDTYGLRVSARLWRLISFRAIPIFLTSTLLVSLATRAHAIPFVTIAVAVVMHSAVTNGRAFINGLIPGRPEANVNYGSYHALAVGITASAALLAFPLFPLTRGLVPSTDSLIDALWTAGLVAVAGAFILRITTNDREDESPGMLYKYERAVRDSGIDLFDAMFQVGAAQGTDPLLIRAIAVVEILQRPKWLRRCERVLGRFRRHGSYGVMQMTSNHPLSDRESIVRFSREHQGDFMITLDESARYSSVNENEIWRIAGQHNGDRQFIDAVSNFYDWFASNILWVQSDSSFGLIGIIEKRRYATSVGYRIATTSEALELVAEEGDRQVSRPRASEPGSWWWIEVEVSLKFPMLFIREEGQEEYALVEASKTAYFA